MKIYKRALALTTLTSLMTVAYGQQADEALVGAPVKRAVPAETAFRPGSSSEKLMATGVPRPDILIVPDLRLTPLDGNVRKALNRWMKDLGYQDVSWQLPKDIPVERNLEFTGTLDRILLDLAETQVNTPRALRFCIHPNRVVSAIPVIQFCKDAS